MTKKRAELPSAAAELVRLAKEQGLSLTGVADRAGWSAQGGTTEIMKEIIGRDIAKS